MIAKWIVIGEIDGKQVDDVAITVLHDIFNIKNNDKTAGSILVSAVDSKGHRANVSVAGFGVAAQHAIEIVLNKHMHEKYKLQNLYYYTDDNKLMDCNISNLID